MTDVLTVRDYLGHLEKMYEEQITHARHHEGMRAQATNYIVVASVALLSLASAQKVFGYDWEPYGKFAICILTVTLNLYGALLSYKHYERSRLHVDVASAYRLRSSAILQQSGFESIADLRQRTHEEHHREFPKTNRIKLFGLWVALHLIFACFAVMLFIFEMLQNARL